MSNQSVDVDIHDVAFVLARETGLGYARAFGLITKVWRGSIYGSISSRDALEYIHEISDEHGLSQMSCALSGYAPTEIDSDISPTLPWPTAVSCAPCSLETEIAAILDADLVAAN